MSVDIATKCEAEKHEGSWVLVQKKKQVRQSGSSEELWHVLQDAQKHLELISL